MPNLGPGELLILIVLMFLIFLIVLVLFGVRRIARFVSDKVKGRQGQDK
jgi:Sec-independent protein translocase protein TatA